MTPSAPEAAKALSAALSALGAPPTPPSTLEWMYAYPAAHALLHAIATGLPPHCALTDSELHLRDISPPDVHVLQRALPALRGKASKKLGRIENLRQQIKLLEAQKDALTPLTRARSPPPDAFADIDPGCDSHSAIATRVLTATKRARIAHATLPEPCVLAQSAPKPVAHLVAAAVDAERKALAAALQAAASARNEAQKAANDDVHVAAPILAAFIPRIRAAARRNGDTEDTVVQNVHQDIGNMLEARNSHRNNLAVLNATTALAAAADARVRTDALARALAARRACLADALPVSLVVHHQVARSHHSATDPGALPTLYADARARVRALWNQPRVKHPITPCGGRTDELVLRCKQAAAVANIAPPHQAARALDRLERAVARNAAALDNLLRERRTLAPQTVPTVSDHAAQAVFRYHVDDPSTNSEQVQPVVTTRRSLTFSRRSRN